ncbi:MAG: aldo/keto reductase [Candidatus Bipolaricaulia bacterium]
MGQQEHTFEANIPKKVRLNYLLFLPKSYGANPQKKWPLILFLHGIREWGNNLELVKRYGIAKVAEGQQDFPFITVSPQCPKYSWWTTKVEALNALLDEVVTTYAVDTDRLYLTGFSMGGYGTWHLATAYPERFAAIAPVCGGGDSKQACALKDLPVWAFHGAKDRVVRLRVSQKMVSALKACGGNVRFTVYTDIGHDDASTQTYENPELYEWFLKYTRQRRQMMRTRKLGWTDLNLSTIGLGTWAIGGGDWEFGWGPQDDQESIATIRRTLELGINWIDTAPAYGLGHSEEVVGKAIKGLKDKPIIATKCGLVWDQDGEIFNRLKQASIRSEVEASLRRLQIDVIDLYQIHWPDPDEDVEEAWGTIADLVKEGKVRYAGASNFSVEQLKRVQSIHPVASLQSPYSMLRRGIEAELLDYCAANDIGVIPYSPMQKGLLTGKFTRERAQNLPENDHRREDPRFHEPELSANLELVENLSAMAEKHGRTVAQLAIAWVLQRPEITAAIVGARRPSQIEETVVAGDWMLTQEDLDAIEKLLAKRQ